MRTLKAVVRFVLVLFKVIQRSDMLVLGVSGHPVPETIRHGFIYVVSEGKYKKWAYLRCPADQNEIIQLSLMPNRRPRWEVTVDALDRPTIYPSIRQLDGSYAHFWIKRGHIEWCEDSGKRSYHLGPGDIFERKA